MPLVQQFSDMSIQSSLLGGIILHHIPVAMALMSMLTDSGINKRSSVFYLLLFASMAPLGALTSQLLNDSLVSEMTFLFDKLMAVVIGIFLHISTTILFESSENHRFNYYKLIIILAGGGVAYLVL
jgi:zinc transporter ZupT